MITKPQVSGGSSVTTVDSMSAWVTAGDSAALLLPSWLPGHASVLKIIRFSDFIIFNRFM